MSADQSLPASADVVVIGAGVFGIAAAYHLAKAGVGRVVVVERSPRVAAQTTFGGAGFVSLWSAGGSEPEFSIERYGRDFYRDLAQRHDIGFKAAGLIFVALSPHAAAQQRAGHARLQRHLPDGEVQLLDAQQVADLAPIFNVTKVSSGEYWPRAVQVDASKAVSAMAAECEALGAQVVCGVQVTGLDAANGRVMGVQTDAGRIATRCVVLAAGAWNARLLDSVGAWLPLFPTHVCRFVTESLGLSDDLPLLLLADYHGLYLREDAGGLLIGSDQTLIHGPALAHHAAATFGVSAGDALPGDVRDLPNDLACYNEWAARNLSEVIPALRDFCVNEVRHGLPARTPDMRPVLGELPQARGCYIIGGDNECGVTRGPGLGKLLAELIVHGHASQDIGPLRPDRWGQVSGRGEVFAIGSLVRQDLEANASPYEIGGA
jgi:glycine/D-amino acid oxidase-like deaminating enzyme